MHFVRSSLLNVFGFRVQKSNFPRAHWSRFRFNSRQSASSATKTHRDWTECFDITRAWSKSANALPAVKRGTAGRHTDNFGRRPRPNVDAGSWRADRELNARAARAVAAIVARSALLARVLAVANRSLQIALDFKSEKRARALPARPLQRPWRLRWNPGHAHHFVL